MAENKKTLDAALQFALDRWNRVNADPDCPLPDTYRAFRTQREGKTLQKKEGYSMKRLRKRVLAAAICASVVLLGTVCAFATVPALREYLHLLFLQEDNTVAPLTEVPDGWIGIYTVDDLEAVRDNLDANYILMCDIRIPDAEYEPGGRYENGFTPIGEARRYYRATQSNGTKTVEEVDPSTIDEQSHDYVYYNRVRDFRGNFNGNGHVLSNVHIRSFVDGRAGLFASVESTYVLGQYKTIAANVTDTENAENYDYDMSTIGGVIKNLGIEDSSVVIDDQDETLQRGRSVYVGMIAGKASTIAGCYVKNVTIDVTSTSGANVFTAGGLAGEALLVDSCYAIADIRTEAYTAYTDREFVNRTGGVAGMSDSCITSYFDGTISTNGEDCGVTYCDGTQPPIMINLPVMEEIVYRMVCHDSGIDFDRDEMTSYREVEAEDRATLSEEELANRDSLNWYETSGHLTDMIRYAKKNGLADDALWNTVKFMSFYTNVKYRQVQDFFTYPVDSEHMEYPFFLDPEIKTRERMELSRLLSLVFTDDEFVTLCQENGIKYGCYDNYDLRYDTDRSYDGFDTNYIWYVQDDGYAVQRLFLFANAHADDETESVTETEVGTEIETETESETAVETETDTEVETESETEAEAETETETETETESESEPETESETETDTEPEPVDNP